MLSVMWEMEKEKYRYFSKKLEIKNFMRTLLIIPRVSDENKFFKELSNLGSVVVKETRGRLLNFLNDYRESDRRKV